MDTVQAALAAFNAGWLTINGYNFGTLVRGRSSDEVSVKELSKLDEKQLPNITVLVPAYHESNVIRHTLRTLSAADYPKDRIEILPLLEREDHATIDAVKAIASSDSKIRPVIIDGEEPKGKPAALNEGLKHATGEIVGVIDAEDKIDPLLFKKVAHKINVSGYDAVQGLLYPKNEEGLVNLMQKAENGYWYGRFLRTLEKSGYPMPLGGTTNFFKKSVLLELGGWDPKNLTEDFDLGLRLFNSKKKVGHIMPDGEHSAAKEKAYKVGMFESRTDEETPIGFEAWLRQRTRWQQGKIQTFKKFLRDPPKTLGKKIHTYMATLEPHLAVVNLTGIGVSAFAYASKAQLEPWLQALTTLNLAAIASYSAMNGLGYLEATKGETVRFRGAKALFAAVSTPAYWTMQWAADLRAIYREEIKKEKNWEKTAHTGKHFAPGASVQTISNVLQESPEITLTANPVQPVSAAESNTHASQKTEAAKPIAPIPAQAKAPVSYDKEELFRMIEREKGNGEELFSAIAREKMKIQKEHAAKPRMHSVKLAQTTKKKRATTSMMSSDIRIAPRVAEAVKPLTSIPAQARVQDSMPMPNGSQENRLSAPPINSRRPVLRRQYPQYDYNSYQEQYARYVKQYYRWLYWARQQQAAGLPIWKVAHLPSN